MVPTPAASQPPLGSGDITARYDDGLPRVIGDQLVLRGQAALDFAATRTDDTPFLITGWVSYLGATRYCSAGLQPEKYSWRADCGAASFTDLAGGTGAPVSAAVTFHFALDRLRTGPVVAVVRVHDPRAIDCGSEARSICDAMMVVQDITWAGDAATSSGPITAEEARNVLDSLDVPGEMGASCMVPPWTGCGIETLTSAEAYPFTVQDDLAPAVVALDIEPSVAALGRALPRAEGVEAALKKGAIVMHAGGKNGFGAPWIWRDYRWLVVGNVAILIRTHSPATAEDREFMKRIFAALDDAR